MLAGKLHVSQNLKWVEKLHYMKQDFAYYNWSLQTFARFRNERVRTDINHVAKEDDVKKAVQKEIKRPGKLLG